MLGLFSLFMAAFMSATILPGVSEAYMVGLYTTGEFGAASLLIAATAGNVAGSCLNYFLGMFMLRYKDKKWFPASDKQIEKGKKMYDKWGKWSLCFAWLPFFGDALTFVAGIFKTNFLLFLVLVTLGKGARYLFVLSAAQAIL